MDDIVKEFLSESFQTVEVLESGVSRFESVEVEPDVVKAVFRGVHTIKGSCGFLGFSRLEALTASGELLLGRLQSGRVQHSPAIAAALEELVRAVREMLEGIKQSGLEVADERRELIARLDALATVPEDTTH